MGRSLAKGEPEMLRSTAAEHIAVEASRLARIAKHNEFQLLAYLIDMVVLEAWREAGEGGSEPADLEELRRLPGES